MCVVVVVVEGWRNFVCCFAFTPWRLDFTCCVLYYTSPLSDPDPQHTAVDASEENSTGYFAVCTKPGQSKPYQAHVWRGGKTVHLGSFATAEEAALCIARSPEGQAAAERAAAAAERAAAAAERAAAAALLTNLSKCTPL